MSRVNTPEGNDVMHYLTIPQPISSTLPRPVQPKRIPPLSESNITSIKNDILGATYESTKKNPDFDQNAMARVLILDEKEFLYEMDKVCSRKRRLCCGGHFVCASIRGNRFCWTGDARYPIINSIRFQDIKEIHFNAKQHSFAITMRKEKQKIDPKKVIKQKADYWFADPESNTAQILIYAIYLKALSGYYWNLGESNKQVLCYALFTLLFRFLFEP